MSREVPLVIYHSPCADGFTAAWVFWKKHPDWEFHAAKYGEAPPNVKGRAVYMLDFSYKRDVLLKMAEEAQIICIIDHHKTAQDDLVDLPGNVFVHFDMTKSGARLAWEFGYAKPELAPEAPAIIKYVEDRDLWRFQYAGTKAISSYVFAHEYDFNVWNNVADDIENRLGQVITAGFAIEKKQQKDVAELSKLKFRVLIGTYVVWAANVPYTYASDLANKLAEGEPFGATFFYDGSRNKYIVSLRSQEDGIDVSEIAKNLGGGGHKHAAGFETQFNPANMAVAQENNVVNV